MEDKNTNSNKKKAVILQVLPTMQSGGVERGTIEIAKGMLKEGFEPIVASGGGNMINVLNSANIKHITLPLDSKNIFVMFANIARLQKIIKENKVDIVHARSRAPAWSAYFACKKTNTWFITTFHGVYSYNNIFKKFYNSVMTRGDRVIAISEFIRKHILDNYKISPKRIRLVHRGVDTEQFNIDTLPKRRIIQMADQLKLEHDKTIIMLPGRLTSWKGHEFLLDALAKISTDKFLCLFVGDDKDHDNYRKKLQEKINKLHLSGSIRFIKHVHDMPAMYSLADIVVSASTRPEAFGRVAVEGQAMGRLTVATAHGGAKETVIDEETGFLVDPHSIDDMASTLEKLIKISATKRKEITSKAKKHANDNFSIKKMIDSTIEIYNELLRTKKSPNEARRLDKESKASEKEEKNIKKTSDKTQKKLDDFFKKGTVEIKGVESPDETPNPIHKEKRTEEIIMEIKKKTVKKAVAKKPAAKKPAAKKAVAKKPAAKKTAAKKPAAKKAVAKKKVVKKPAAKKTVAKK